MIHATAGRSVRSWRGLVLALLRAVGPATRAPPRCREVPTADALRRLAVGGREWAGARGPVIARASRRVAVLAVDDGAVLEVLVLMALDDAHGPVETPLHRPRWVLCVGERAERRRGG